MNDSFAVVGLPQSFICKAESIFIENKTQFCVVSMKRCSDRVKRRLCWQVSLTITKINLILCFLLCKNLFIAMMCGTTLTFTQTVTYR